MKKILCLTDFSDNAYNGILYANELAKKKSATLIFMHTYELCEDWHEEVLHHPSSIAYTDTESRDKLYKICMDFIKENKYSNVNYEYLVKEGYVNQNLNQIINEEKIDLVVFSVEGELRPNDAHYGNIVSDIVQKALCPIIVVPIGCSLKGIQNIVYVYDIEHENTFEKEAIEFARLFDARLNILSFNNEEDEKKSDNLYSKFNHLKDDSEYDKISFDIKATSDMVTALYQFTIERNADLLILENHKRILYEELTEPNFTKKFVFFSKIPVLIIRSL